MPKEYFKLTDTAALSTVPSGGSVHFIGVAGVAMGQLAAALAERGYRVTGSDKRFYEPMGSFLRGTAVELLEGYAAENVPQQADLVVIGNAVSYGHPEVAVVEDRELPYTCFPQLLYEVMIEGKASIVVCGTHGKSTTTAMTAAALQSLEQEPSFFIGGVSTSLGTSFKTGSGSLSVVEGDEYDSAFFAKTPKFKFYRPNTCIINAVEFDHADIYQDLAAINQEFDDLALSLTSADCCICCVDEDNLRQLAVDWKERCSARVITFGFSEDADYRIVEQRQEGLEQVFHWRGVDGDSGECRLGLIGRYNALNALATIIACSQHGITPEKAGGALRQYQGVKRRQEIRFSDEHTVLIEDFAHHPTAVRGTIDAVRQAFPDHSLWAVFEPRSNTSRRRIFQQDYLTAFSKAQHAVLAEVQSTVIDAGHELLNVHELAEDIAAAGTPCTALPNAEAICSQVMEQLSGPSVILVMSNGSFDGLVGLFEERLRRQRASE